MPHIQLENVGFSYPDKTVLKDINWRIDQSSRIGLVGRNGTGKTTLLEIITGGIQPDSGLVYRSKDLKIGYLRQHYGERTGLSLRQYLMKAFTGLSGLRSQMRELEKLMKTGDPESLKRYGRLQERYEIEGGYTFESRMKKVSQGLGFSEMDLDKSLTEFSGGEANKAALSRVLIEEPNLLILDEPTNHLDIDALEWLEHYLLEFNGGIMMVTHDRYFLDKTVTIIAELKHCALELYHGNYSHYVTEKQDRTERAQKTFRHQQEFIRKTEDFIRRNIAGQKTKQAKSRIKMLGKLERLEKPLTDGRSMAFSFDTDHYGGYVLAEIEDVCMRFDTKTVLDKVNARLLRGGRIGLIGPNGSGKSTLLSVIRGSLAPTKGRVTVGYKAKIGYYDQQLREVDPAKTVIEDFTDGFPAITNQDARSFLGRFLFTGDEVFKPVRVLSGGETARLALAKIIFSRPNLLLLDEPTNHLDVAGREVLETALQEFSGAIILVSHDRYLLDKVVDRIWLLHEHRLLEYLGNYSEFKERRAKEMDRRNQAGADSRRKSPAPPARRQSKKQIRQKRALDRSQHGPTADALETEIAALEHQLQDIRLQLFDGRHGSNWELLADLHEEEQKLLADIDRLLALWEKAVEREKST